jgi:hypothetical protein
MAAVLFMGPAAMVGPTVSAQPAAPAPAVLTAPAETRPADPLPWITAASSVPAAPGDTDTPYSGVLAAPRADGLTVYATADGKAFALLPTRVVDSDGSDRTWMPVVGSAAGPWLQVLLPARRNLPSTGAPVNGATGWVRASDVLTKASAVTVAVNLTARTITIAGTGNTPAVFPVSISGGEETTHGRSFVLGRYATAVSQRCSAQPMLILSAQSESEDGYFHQDTAVQAIHAFSNDCRNISGYTQATPGCIIANEADIPRLLALVPDGTPVTVK